MTGTLLGRLSIWQLLEKPEGHVANTISVNVHSTYVLMYPYTSTVKVIFFNKTISFMKTMAYQ